jgi:hypothetical protein
MDISDDWWVEHIIPHSLGGSDETDNLLPSCRLCNFALSKHSPEYVRRLLVIGSALIREVDRGSQLGLAVDTFLQMREQRLAKKRKHPDLAMNAAAKNTIRQERLNANQGSFNADVHSDTGNARV